MREEARIGRDKGKLIPLMVDKTPAPFGFGEVQAADLSAWNGYDGDPAWQAEGVEGVGFGEAADGVGGEAGGAAEVGDGGEAADALAGFGDSVGEGFAEALDEAEAEADGGAGETPGGFVWRKRRSDGATERRRGG